MTNEQAIEIIQGYKRLDEYMQNTRRLPACDLAIQALQENDKLKAELAELKERDVAKKPKEYEDKYYGCPVCDNIVMLKWLKYPIEKMKKESGLPYCLGCGQKLDWSGEDE